MPTRPHLSEREITRALQEQGFRIEGTRSGARVLAPDGESSSGWHPGTFGQQGGRRAYQNQLSELQRIGFDLDRATQPKARKRAANGHPSGNGHPSEEAVVSLVAQDPVLALEELKGAASALAEEVASETGTDKAERIAALSPGDRRVYDVITARPGLHLRDYNPSIPEMTTAAFRMHANRLVLAGLLERSGRTASIRYWLQGTSPEPVTSPRPGSDHPAPPPRSRSGPVRTRHIEPADPVVRFERLAEKAAKLSGDLAEVVGQMVAGYAEAQEELKALRRKDAKMQDILGRAVDAL